MISPIAFDEVATPRRGLAQRGVEPPSWVFAWPGRQAIARYMLDHPGMVAGRRVLEFAAARGIAAIACACSGAASVKAAEMDPLAVAAIGLNASLVPADVLLLPSGG